MESNIYTKIIKNPERGEEEISFFVCHVAYGWQIRDSFVLDDGIF